MGENGLQMCYLFLNVIVAIFASEDCTRFVQSLSKNDIFLNGRKTLATDLMKSNATAAIFVNALDSSNVTAGDKYQCGNTRYLLGWAHVAGHVPTFYPNCIWV